MKRFGLELGGKAPMIVFDDADIDAMLPVLEKALTIFAGQFCKTGSPLLVQSSIYERVRHGLAQKAACCQSRTGIRPGKRHGAANRQTERRPCRQCGERRAGRKCNSSTQAWRAGTSMEVCTRSSCVIFT